MCFNYAVNTIFCGLKIFKKANDNLRPYLKQLFTTVFIDSKYLNSLYLIRK